MPGTRRRISQLLRRSLFCILWPWILSSTAWAQFNPDCHVSHFHFINEGVTPATMWLRSGGGCRFHFESNNSVYGLAGILSANVTLRPKSGLLGRNTIRIFVYKPNDGFVGTD
jgi:hypothetical protein